MKLTHDFNELVQLLRPEPALLSHHMALGQRLDHAGNKGIPYDLANVNTGG